MPVAWNLIRYPTKLAFCSRFRRQREAPVNVADRRFSLASGSRIVAKQRCKNASPTKHKKAGGGKPPAFAQRAETYLISAFAPASSSFFFASSAAAFGTDSFTGFGA